MSLQNPTYCLVKATLFNRPIKIDAFYRVDTFFSAPVMDLSNIVLMLLRLVLGGSREYEGKGYAIF